MSGGDRKCVKMVFQIFSIITNMFWDSLGTLGSFEKGGTHFKFRHAGGVRRIRLLAGILTFIEKGWGFLRRFVWYAIFYALSDVFFLPTLGFKVAIQEGRVRTPLRVE